MVKVDRRSAATAAEEDASSSGSSASSYEWVTGEFLLLLPQLNEGVLAHAAPLVAITTSLSLSLLYIIHECAPQPSLTLC